MYKGFNVNDEITGVRGSLAQTTQGKKSGIKRKAEEADNAEEPGRCF